MNSQEPVVTAVVMAGGKGTRLVPLTASRPKPLVPVVNRPIMSHILTLLERHGIRETIATVHYRGDDIQSYYGDGFDFGVSLQYSLETRPLGTAGSVKQAESLITGNTILVISGDALTDCDLTAAIKFHREKKSLATLVLCRVPDPSEFGVVVTDPEGRVVRFLEKPSMGEVFSDTVNTGIYILEPEALELIACQGECDWSSDVFPHMLAASLPIYGWIMNGYWCDVGSFSQYQEAQEDFLLGKVKLPLTEDLDVLPPNGISLGQNTIVEDGAHLKAPVVIGNNCRIKSGASIGPFTVIGDNTVIEETASLDRTVCWDGVYVGHSSSASRAVLCSRVVIKRDCIIGEDAVVADRGLVEAGCTLRPKVKIWPNKTISRGSTVAMNLIHGGNSQGSLFRDMGAAGLSNLEITPEVACRLGSAFGSAFIPHSQVITSRDTTRSSRMVKRAIISGLVSSGCEVLDLRSIAAPIARHFTKLSGAAGAIHVRKMPNNTRVTLVEMMDSRGAYISRGLERKVESAYFREDIRRASTEEIGRIEFGSRAIEGYQSDFSRLLDPNYCHRHRIKVVCDYGFTSLASILPAMLSKIGVDSMSLNAFDDGKRAPRTEKERAAHLNDLASIVRSTGSDLGMLFTSDGERMTLVDSSGTVVTGPVLMGVVAKLFLQFNPGAAIAMPVTAPTKLASMLTDMGGEVIRTRMDARSLMESATDSGAALVCDGLDGFIFPEMQNGFDAPYSFGKLLTLLGAAQTDLRTVVSELPPFYMSGQSVPVSWEFKGTVMRMLAERAQGCSRTEHLDGLKVYSPESWALVIPDSLEPQIHIFTEGDTADLSRREADDYAQLIQSLVEEARLADAASQPGTPGY